MTTETNDFNIDLNAEIKKMDQFLDGKEEKETQTKYEEIVKENKKARDIITQFTKKLNVDVDGVLFVLKPITVEAWDVIGGQDANEEGKTKAVYMSILSPKFTEEEFRHVPASIKFRLYTILMSDFFEMAGRITIKE